MPPESQRDLETYAEVLSDVKRRLKASGLLLEAGPSGDRLEVVALHLRNILEALMLGSLIPHRTLLAQTQKQLRKLEADEVRKRLRVQHPNYWPVAQQMTLEDGQHVVRPRTGMFVLEKDWGRWFGKTSNLLHQRNPLADPVQVEQEHEDMFDLHDRLVGLLDVFSVFMVHRPAMLLCQMDASPTGDHEPGDGKISVHWLDRTGDLPAEFEDTKSPDGPDSTHLTVPSN